MTDLIKDAEFKEGDEVTFKPYEKACACKVVGVRLGSWKSGKTMHGEPDDRIFYKLTGEAVSITTGKSIVESKLFESYVGES